MAVNATTQFWEDLPPSSAPAGQTIVATARITNTGNQTEDFRLSVQVRGIGAGIFTVPMETWSSGEELSPNELYTAQAMFTMPNYGVQLTVQAEWYNRAGAPAQWVKVGTSATRNIALLDSEQFPVPQQPAPVVQVGGLQISQSTIILRLVAVGVLFFLMRKK